MSNNHDVSDALVQQTDGQPASLYQRVVDLILAREWNYSGREDDGFILLNLRLRDGSVRAIVDVAESPGWSRLLVYAIFPVFVPQHRRPAVLDAINRINYVQVLGNFEMDPQDGQDRTRAVMASDVYLADALIDRTLRMALDLADQHLAGLLAVAFGGSSAADILELAGRDSGPTLQ